MKFEKGDIITSKSYYHGFENAKIIGTTVEGGKQCYVLKILNGTATLPVIMENNYSLKKD